MENTSPSIPWKILVIDDDRDDFLIIKDVLAGSSPDRYVLEWAGTFDAGQRMLRSCQYDAIILDYSLGEKSGIDLLRELDAPTYDFPFILLSGYGSPEVFMDAMEAGAAYTLTKNEMSRSLLERGIQYAVKLKREEIALRKSNKALEASSKALIDQEILSRESRQRTIDILTSIEDGLFGLDREWRFTYVNPRAARNVGYTPEQLTGRNIWEVFPTILGTEHERVYRQVMEERRPADFDYQGALTRQYYNIRVFPSAEGITIYWVDINDQVQARRRIEQELAERERVKVALLESEEKFRAAFDNAAIGMALTAPDGRFVDANPAYCTITGYPKDELLALRFTQIVHPDDFEKNMAITEQMIRGEIVDFVVENRYVRKDGQTVWVRKSVSPVRTAGGAVQWIVALVENITERKQAEAAQREAEQALQKSNDALFNERNLLLAVMEALPVGLAIYDNQGGVIQANAEFEEVWGSPRPPAGSVDEYDAYKAWWAETGRPVLPEEWAAAAAVQHGKTIKGQFIEIQRFDGKRGFVVNSGAPVRDGEGRLIGATVAIMDITERIRAEKERHEAQIQSEIQRRLLENREQERQEIARDLHDGPVQLLSATMFQLQVAREMEQDSMLKLELDQAARNLKATVRELREMMNELRPPAIIRFGLSKSIRIYLEDFREKHPEIHVTPHLFDDGNVLPEQVRLALFRIFQESLNNIVKHAGASSVSVRLTYKENRVRLQIHDNGKGFDRQGSLVEYTQRGHYGLAGMKERAEAVGGEFTVASEIGKGTTITVTVGV